MNASRSAPESSSASAKTALTRFSSAGCIVNLLRDLANQEGLGEGPLALDRPRRNTQRAGRLFDTQPGVKPEPHDASGIRVLLLKARNRLIKGQNLIRVVIGREVDHIQRQFSQST